MSGVKFKVQKTHCFGIGFLTYSKKYYGFQVGNYYFCLVVA